MVVLKPARRHERDGLGDLVVLLGLGLGLRGLLELLDVCGCVVLSSVCLHFLHFLHLLHTASMYVCQWIHHYYYKKKSSDGV